MVLGRRDYLSSGKYPREWLIQIEDMAYNVKTTEFIKKLPRAVELATQHILEINKEDNKGNKEGDTEFEYEATLRAINERY